METQVKKYSYTQLKNILVRYYKLDMIRKISCSKHRPAYEKMLNMWREFGIPLCVWEDVKKWRANEFKLDEAQIKAEQMAWAKLGYELKKKPRNAKRLLKKSAQDEK